MGGLNGIIILKGIWQNFQLCILQNFSITILNSNTMKGHTPSNLAILLLGFCFRETLNSCTRMLIAACL